MKLTFVSASDNSITIRVSLDGANPGIAVSWALLKGTAPVPSGDEVYRIVSCFKDSTAVSQSDLVNCGSNVVGSSKTQDISINGVQAGMEYIIVLLPQLVRFFTGSTRGTHACQHAGSHRVCYRPLPAVVRGGLRLRSGQRPLLRGLPGHRRHGRAHHHHGRAIHAFQHRHALCVARLHCGPRLHDPRARHDACRVAHHALVDVGHHLDSHAVVYGHAVWVPDSHKHSRDSQRPAVCITLPALDPNVVSTSPSLAQTILDVQVAVANSAGVDPTIVHVTYVITPRYATSRRLSQNQTPAPVGTDVVITASLSVATAATAQRLQNQQANLTASVATAARKAFGDGAVSNVTVSQPRVVQPAAPPTDAGNAPSTSGQTSQASGAFRGQAAQLPCHKPRPPKATCAPLPSPSHTQTVTIAGAAAGCAAVAAVGAVVAPVVIRRRWKKR